MLNVIRRPAKAALRRDNRDERRAESRPGPLVRMLHCDLAYMDNLTRAFSGRRSGSDECDMK